MLEFLALPKFNMSFEYYTNWWIVNKKQLEDVYVRDEIFRKKAKPIQNRNLANMLLGGLYAKYSLLVQEIDGCLDQMAQPQKRNTVKKLLDAATIRLSELNDQLKIIDFSEFHYIDGSLVELKLIPYDIEILHPSMFFSRPIDIEDMWQKLQKGEKIFVPPESERPTEEADQSEKVVQPEEIVEEGKKSKDKKSRRPKTILVTEDKLAISEEEREEIKRKQVITNNIKLIQTAERARQERMYFFIKDQIFKRNEAAKKLAQLQPQSQKTPQIEEIVKIPPSPIKIQAAWRGRSARELVKFKELERRMLIKMYEPSWRSKKEFEIFEKNLNKRREYRDQRIREYIQSIDQEKARILRVVAPGLMEDIGDEIREWFRIWYVEARLFDKYPPEEKGGTILVVRGETMTPKEYLDEYERKRREKVKAGGADKQKEKEKLEKLKKAEAEKKKKEAEKKKKEAEAKKKKKKNAGEFEFEYTDTAAKSIYDEGMREHRTIWDERNDFENPLEKHYMDMITEEKCYEVQMEVRQKIDELMRIELEMLEDALEQDKIRLTGKKGKKKNKKKGKKRKKGKKGKKDPTANRTTEDLFQELYDNGIIRTYPPTRLDQFEGDFSYKNWELRNKDFDPPATLLDVRQAIVMNCIAPLGVEVMKRPRSVLIAGPRQSGKHLLANAIFNETKCVLFDLSPERTAGKYPGAKGMKLFIHLINKMSKLLAPSILYFDGAERIFYKKVPKEEKELDPKRMGKKLLKGIIKTITPENRVLVLGITGKPWAGQAAKMKKTFERNILIPRPDYGSIYLYWRDLLMPYHGVDRNFNVSALATVTMNYPLPVIREALRKIMTPRRIIELKYNPLTPQEVYEIFIAESIEPISDKEYKKFLKWYKSTPLGRQRAAFNKWADGQRELEARQKEKENKKK